MKFWIAAAAGCIALAAPAAAQVGLEGNLARADDRWGAEIGVGYALDLGVIKIVPAGGVLVSRRDDDRYRFDSGSDLCRDTQGGGLVDEDRCRATSARLYGRVEALATLPLLPRFGVGVRFGREATPYGTVAFPILPGARLKANAGPDYFAAGLNLGF